MMFFQSVLFSMSFSLTPTFPISSFTTSKNLLFSLPLFLFPSNSISITLLCMYSWSLFMTCPYHLSLPFLIFIPNDSTLTVPIMYLFLILSCYSYSKPQHFHLCNFHLFYLFFCDCHYLKSITITGLTTELYTIPFTLAGNLLLQITPDTFLHLFHSACTFLYLPLTTTSFLHC